MAIVFMLAVNFGDNQQAIEEVASIVRTYPDLQAGQHRIAIGHLSVITVRPSQGQQYQEMSICPRQVSHGAAFDQGYQRIPLTAAEFTELGRALYALLANFTGYRVAMVGWDPESVLDPVELSTEYAEELAAGTLPGLVLSNEVAQQLAVGSLFVPFTEGFVWVPYQGQQPSTLTADY